MNTIAIKFGIFLPVLIFSLTFCVTQEDAIYIKNQVDVLVRKSKQDEKKFEESFKKLEEKTKADESMRQEIKKSLNEDQEAIRFHLAQVEADLLEIRDRIQGLTGKVEENSHLLKGAIEEDTTKVDAMAYKIKELSSVVDELKPRIEKIESSLSFTPSVNKKTTGLEKVVPVQGRPQKDISPPQKKEPTEPEMYDRALGHYRGNRYEEAMTGFKNFLKLYPKSDLADNAQFWIAECHRGLKKYEEAILAYQKVINGYPKGNKVPSAMLQQALTFEKINEKTPANLVFKKLVTNFPKTKEAEIARKRLKQKK